MVPSVRQRRPVLPVGAFTPALPRAAGRDGIFPSSAMAHVSAPTPPGRAARERRSSDRHRPAQRGERAYFPVPRWRTSRHLPHRAERRAGKGTPTSGRHSPPKAGGREGPRVSEWLAFRPVPRRSASSGRLRGTRLSLRSGQRCRPRPGELARGRRSLAGGAISMTGIPARLHFRSKPRKYPGVRCPRSVHPRPAVARL